jgi:predicted DNA-binding transcriptional regulator YafY
MLGLLSLLQHRSTWSGAELAERLGVTDRTVRRDIDRLRELGYPVEAAPGVAGGYRLGRGGRLPPLLLRDDEAMAVALGLRVAVDGNVTGLEEAAISVLGRLEQILPQHLAARVRAVHEATTRLEWHGDEPVSSGVLVGLAQACGRSERVRFAYTDRAGQASDRLVEPYRLVRVGARWYLVCRDVDRRAWRTFRVDRLSQLDPVGTTFTVEDPPDAVAMVRQGLRAREWPFEAQVRILAPSDEVAAVIPSAIGLVEVDATTTIVDIGALSSERMVRYLAGLPFACEVLRPAPLREALRRHAAAVATANATR